MYLFIFMKKIDSTNKDWSILWIVCFLINFKTLAGKLYYYLLAIFNYNLQIITNITIKLILNLNTEFYLHIK